jgi:hypothetical protein
MNESCAKYIYDHPLFTFLFECVGPVERCDLLNFGGPWRTIAADLQTFEEKTNKTFYDASWMLTMTWVAPECQDTARLACLCCGTWLMGILTKMKKRVYEKGH